MRSVRLSHQVGSSGAESFVRCPEIDLQILRCCLVRALRSPARSSQSIEPHNGTHQRDLKQQGEDLSPLLIPSVHVDDNGGLLLCQFARELTSAALAKEPHQLGIAATANQRADSPAQLLIADPVLRTEMLKFRIEVEVALELLGQQEQHTAPTDALRQIPCLLDKGCYGSCRISDGKLAEGIHGGRVREPVQGRLRAFRYLLIPIVLGIHKGLDCSLALARHLRPVRFQGRQHAQLNRLDGDVTTLGDDAAQLLVTLLRPQGAQGIHGGRVFERAEGGGGRRAYLRVVRTESLNQIPYSAWRGVLGQFTACLPTQPRTQQRNPGVQLAGVFCEVLLVQDATPCYSFFLL